MPAIQHFHEISNSIALVQNTKITLLWTSVRYTHARGIKQTHCLFVSNQVCWVDLCIRVNNKNSRINHGVDSGVK